MEPGAFVFELLENFSTNVFLTGKAGTGKTTLLHDIKKHIRKNHVVVAPTSVAAINAGGVTMHSFFQLPFGPIVPRSVDHSVDQSLKYSQEKLRLIRSLELIIIDEISMVRADLLDHLDFLLRMINLTNEPFGGIQLLLIGDPLQLPPIKENWGALSKYYDSPYFFDCMALKEAGFIAIELLKVYRQDDPLFVELLNSARTGSMDASMLDLLNQRYSDAAPVTDERYITITTHHKIVNQINKENLDALPGETFTYKASLSGDFPVDSAPAEETLELKVGARVIMIKNDDSGKKAYYNGRAAQIAQLTANGITLEFLDDHSQLNLAPQTWHHVKYDLAPGVNKITESDAGSFTQYPIKLAWAITVHKSQGLTFDHVILDIAGCFEPGQAYVALSRCRSLNGIIMRTRVFADNIKTDQVAVRFMNSIQMPEDAKTFLCGRQIAEQHQFLKSFFDFSAIEDRLVAIESLIESTQLNALKIEFINVLRKEVIRPATKFSKSELHQVNSALPPFEIAGFDSRILTASAYFEKHIGSSYEAITLAMKATPELSGDTSKAKQLLNEILHLLMVKSSIFEQLSQRTALSTIRKSCIEHLSKPIVSVKIEKDEVPLAHPALYDQLTDWRRTYSSQRSLPLHIIMAEKTLRKIAEKTPRTLEQFSSIPGIGPIKAKEIGQMIIDIINRYFGTQQLF